MRLVKPHPNPETILASVVWSVFLDAETIELQNLMCMKL